MQYVIIFISHFFIIDFIFEMILGLFPKYDSVISSPVCYSLHGCC